MKSPRVLAITVLVAGSLLLAGCSVDPSGGAQNAGNNAQNTEQSPNSQQSEGGSGNDANSDNTAAGGDQATSNNDGSNAAEFGIDPNNPPPAIATVSAPGDASKKFDKVTYELVDLQRRDKLLVAMFRMTVEGGFADAALHEATGWLGSGPEMFDTENLKVYKPVSNLQSNASTKVLPGQPVYFTAGWGYPEGVAKVDIQINGSVPLMTAVAVPQ